MRTRLLAYALTGVVIAGGLAAVSSAQAAVRPGDDAVVVAVIDSGISPYHWDFLAEHMPQAKTPTKSDDLPLNKAPHTWLSGFPKPSAFASYKPLSISRDPKNGKREHKALRDKDEDRWSDVEISKPGEPAYYWLPGTKVIGAMAWGAPSSGALPIYGTGPAEHGMGTSSVSVGNIYGACPECLLVFLQASAESDYEAAIEWALKQPWIDAISNSYGMSSSVVLRDRVYGGSDVNAQRAAVDRGQEVFFSAGNGVMNDFVTPNGTLMSSQEGPDWIVTVGATDPSNTDYPGAGKPADIAGVGTMYPSAYGGATVTGKGDFSGTSNATPTIAGTYARALWKARQALSGPSRVQARGVVAKGGRYACGRARKACELGDGVLTRKELETRLFQGATPTPGGFAGRRKVPSSVLGLVPVPAPVGGAPIPFLTTPPVADTRRLSEGYGTYRARLDGTAKWLAEFDSRFFGPLTGAKAAPGRPAGDVEWFRVDSWCRQHIWGEWTGGAYVNDTATPLPAPDPATPTRNAYQNGCRGMTRPPA
ncbi:MAG TPA: S8/S53 family peptidase [Mycobacteriales bacterium]|jgi:hypothetical protein